MTRTHHIGQTVVPYEIDWSEGRETVSLSMDESMELTVRAPMTATVSDVEGVLNSRSEWLLEKLYGLAEQADIPQEKEFLSGEKLQYAGRRYPLTVIEADVPEPRVSFDGTEFTMEVHRFDAPGDDVSVRRKRQAVVDWCVDRASEDLPQRVRQYRSKLGADEVSTDVRELEDRWGVYDDGVVSLNWRLVLAPVRIQDYVVVHELAHTKHGDHSTGFWNTVGAIIPDYEQRREWLRINGHTLRVV